MKTKTMLAMLSLALGAVIALPAGAQEVLPHPPQPFKGKIGRTAAESTPDFPNPIEAPKGAPNVLLIMPDDVGFSASSTYRIYEVGSFSSMNGLLRTIAATLLSALDLAPFSPSETQARAFSFGESGEVRTGIDQGFRNRMG